LLKINLWNVSYAPKPPICRNDGRKKRSIAARSIKSSANVVDEGGSTMLLGTHDDGTRVTCNMSHATKHQVQTLSSC
jgi:hypothetical protein